MQHTALSMNNENTYHKKLRARVEEYLSKNDYEKAIKLAEEIGAMLWGILRKIK